MLYTYIRMYILDANTRTYIHTYIHNSLSLFIKASVVPLLTASVAHNKRNRSEPVEIHRENSKPGARI